MWLLPLLALLGLLATPPGARAEEPAPPGVITLERAGRGRSCFAVDGHCLRGGDFYDLVGEHEVAREWRHQARLSRSFGWPGLGLLAGGLALALYGADSRLPPAQQGAWVESGFVCMAGGMGLSVTAWAFKPSYPAGPRAIDLARRYNDRFDSSLLLPDRRIMLGMSLPFR